MAEEIRAEDPGKALGTAVLTEILGLRERVTHLTRERDNALSDANSMSARFDEANTKARAAEAAQRQMEGALKAAEDTIPTLHARVQKLEGDLRHLADALAPVHLKAQSLRPE